MTSVPNTTPPMHSVIKHVAAAREYFLEIDSTEAPTEESAHELLTRVEHLLANLLGAYDTLAAQTAFLAASQGEQQ